jgi:hypothetical protein
MAKMIITFEAEGVEELKGRLIAFLQGLGFNPNQQELPLPITSSLPDRPSVAHDEDKSEESAPKVTEITKKRGRPKKEAEVKQPSIFEDAPAQAAVEPPAAEEVKVPVTKETIIGALQELANAKGIERAREVLSRFGCLRASEVKEADYPKLLKLCQEEALIAS